MTACPLCSQSTMSPTHFFRKEMGKCFFPPQFPWEFQFSATLISNWAAWAERGKKCNCSAVAREIIVVPLVPGRSFASPTQPAHPCGDGSSACVCSSLTPSLEVFRPSSQAFYSLRPAPLRRLPCRQYRLPLAASSFSHRQHASLFLSPSLRFRLSAPCFRIAIRPKAEASLPLSSLEHALAGPFPRRPRAIVDRFLHTLRELQCAGDC